MDLPISITSAVAATRRQDFIAQADVDRMARLARHAGHRRRGHFLARFVAVIHGHLIGGQAMPQFMDFHEDLKPAQEALEQIAIGTQQGATDEYVRQHLRRLHPADTGRKLPIANDVFR